MSYQNRFFVSVLILTEDGRVVIFKKPSSSPTGDPKDFCWVPVYKKLTLEETPKNGAALATELSTGLRIKPDLFQLVHVESKPIEEYKCWMFVIKISGKLASQIKSIDLPHTIVPLTEIPHPQNWILNAYLELGLSK